MKFLPERFRAAALVAGLLAAPHFAAAEEAARFYRGIVLNGPPLKIDGHQWEGREAKDFSATGNTFEDQKVVLKPPTDEARSRMLRASRWGTEVDLELRQVPPGAYQVFVYVWEDNSSERFRLLVNDRVVLPQYDSGSAGTWKKLGPWICQSDGGKIRIAARGGAANLSGLEIWQGSSAPGFNVSPAPEQVAFFESKIRPVLAQNCSECHSATAAKLRGGLLLDSRSGIMKGGDSGAVIIPGDPAASRLISAVRHLSADLAMPPKKSLAAHEIADLEEWVKMGAPDPRTEDTVAVVRAKTAIDWTKARDWWSLRPLSQPAAPLVKNAGWPAGELDRFILSRLEAAGLEPAADAEKPVLLRRVTYDLTGLPPTPEELEAFLADPSPDAFEKTVDRLLASPRYGERWGRHWLDVVRYADTAGDNSDFPIPQQHLYRDWVIAAFNRDLPYDQFVREQIAGDLMPGGRPEEARNRIIATGYLANARRFGSRVDDYPWHLTIEDTLDNFGRSFLGTSLNCARCHDHKFDPITSEDYYALYGIFSSTRYPWPGIELDQRQRDLAPLVPAGQRDEARQAQKKHEDEARRLAGELKTLEEALKDKSGAEKESLEKKVAAAREAANRHAERLSFEFAYAVSDAPNPADAAVQQKGDPAKPGLVVRRRFLKVLGGAELPPDDRSSGRLHLANWLFDSSNPLPARVMVNRLWLHHFGKGLVPTPNDFGRQGKPPTHPELLDWLAARFVAEGWSIKKMHRLMVLSRTYRMSSSMSGGAKAADPNNELLSAFPRKRLDAEALRDTLLMLGGSLDLSPGGAHPFPKAGDWKFTQHNPFKAVYETSHRSVYLMTQRIQRHPFLAIFDGADPSASTAQRLTSTTPLQALFLLNDPLVHETSRRIAGRLLNARNATAGRLELASLLIFSRPAAAAELARAEGFLEAAGSRLREAGTAPNEIEAAAWQALVRSLLRTNEFLYLD